MRLPLGKSGTYAERRYRQGMKSWHRALRRSVLVVLGPILCASIVWGLGFAHVRAAFVAGFIAGVSGLLLGLAWLIPPTYLENWELGYLGEEKTSRVLAKLGWQVVEDVQTERRGNYDHIVVGPPGVFLIESKYRRGTVEISDGQPRLTHRYDPEASESLWGAAEQAKRASREIYAKIREQLGESPNVRPIVVLWNAFPAGYCRAHSVDFVHGKELLDHLRGSEPRPKLSAERQEAVARVLASL